MILSFRWLHFSNFTFKTKISLYMYAFQVKHIAKGSSKEKDNSLQLAKTLCIIFVVFAACWTPYTTMAVRNHFSLSMSFKTKDDYKQSLLGCRLFTIN